MKRDLWCRAGTCSMAMLRTGPASRGDSAVANWGRRALAVVILAAVGIQFWTGTTGTPGFRGDNFFSFFTIQSNLIAAAVLLARRNDSLRGAATLYLIITGVVYATLLSGLERTLQTPLPWVNFVLHRLSPVALVIDWLAAPPRRPLRFRAALLWLVYPLLYLGYSLVRGASVGWYPYPFLDPRHVGGYDRVALVCGLIALGALVAAGLVVWSGNWRARRRVTGAAPPGGGGISAGCL